MYWIGDVAVVRPDLSKNLKYNGIDVAYEMEEYRGQPVTICGLVEDGVYSIEEDGQKWIWSEGMLIRPDKDEDYDCTVYDDMDMDAFYSLIGGV